MEDLTKSYAIAMALLAELRAILLLGIDNHEEYVSWERLTHENAIKLTDLAKRIIGKTPGVQNVETTSLASLPARVGECATFGPSFGSEESPSERKICSKEEPSGGELGVCAEHLMEHATDSPKPPGGSGNSIEQIDLFPELSVQDSPVD